MAKIWSAILLATAIWTMIVATMVLEAGEGYAGIALAVSSFGLLLVREQIK